MSNPFYINEERDLRLKRIRGLIREQRYPDTEAFQDLCWILEEIEQSDRELEAAYEAQWDQREHRKEVEAVNEYLRKNLKIVESQRCELKSALAARENGLYNFLLVVAIAGALAANTSAIMDGFNSLLEDIK